MSGIIIVYPLHINGEEVVKIAAKKQLTLKEKKFDDRLLIFSKSSEFDKEWLRRN